MELKDNYQLASRVKIAYLFLSLVSVLFAVSCFMDYSSTSAFELESEGVLDEVSSYDLIHLVSSLLFALMYIASSWALTIWCKRVYRNLNIIEPNTMLFTEGKVGFSYKVIKEIWNDIQRHTDGTSKPKLTLVNACWISHLIGLFYLITIGWIFDGLITEQDYYLHLGIACLTIIPSFILICMFISKIAKGEDILREKYHTIDITKHLIDNTTKAY